jgi:hypothetical protein
MHWMPPVAKAAGEELEDEAADKVPQIIRDLFTDAIGAQGHRSPRAAEMFTEAVNALVKESAPNATGRIPYHQAHAILERYKPLWNDKDFQDIGSQFSQLVPRYDADKRLVDIYLSHPELAGAESLDQAIKLAQRKELQDLDQGGTVADNLIKLRRTWGADLVTDPEDHAMLSRYLRQQAGKLSGKSLEELATTNPIFDDNNLKAWRNMMQAWRQHTLSFPVSVVNNLAEMETMSLAGFGHRGTIDLPHHLQQMLGESLKLAPEGIRGVLDKLPKIGGLQRRLIEKTDQESPIILGKRQLHGLDIEPPEVAKRGSSMEAFLPDQRLLERVPGYGRWVEAHSHAHGIAEKTGRTAAFYAGLERHVSAQAGELAQGVTEALAQTRLTPGAQLQVQQLAETLIESERAFNPVRIAGWVTERGGSAKDALAVLDQLSPLHRQAVESGVKHADHLHFPYKYTNLDEGLRNFLGFHYFASRRIPLYMEVMATHPALAMAAHQWQDAADEIQEAEGLENARRFEDAAPLRLPGLSNLLFGRDGEVWFNPTRLLSLLEPLVDEAHPYRGATPVASALDYGSNLGLNPSPPLRAALEVSGLLGGAPAQPVLRSTPLVNATLRAVTGEPVDVEGPLTALREQRPLGGTKPTDDKVFVRLRLMELSLEQTGRPNDPTYVQAMREGPSNPLWRQAEQQLGGDQGKERLAALLGIPLRFDSAAAGALR